MFRFIHTADWHLGQSFHGYDRDYEHGRFFDWLLATVVERRPDALIVAGDVFDTVNPAASAQRRFYDFLARVHAAAPDVQVVLTAGNHDAAARLEAPTALFQSLNITAIGTVARDADGALDCRKFLVPLKGANGKIEAIAVAVPFLRPSDVPEMPDAADPYLDGIRELYRRAADAARTLRDSHYPQAVLVALGHCHLQDGEESRDSERRLVVGGAEALNAEVFPADFAYVALGHLHKPQEFQGGRIQYSGSPIPLSFAEKDYPHRVVEVEADSTGLRCTTLPVPKTASLICLPEDGAKPIDDVLQSIDATCFDAGVADDERPFLEVRVLDDGPDPTRRSRIERALQGKAVRLATIKLESPRREGGADTSDETEAALADLSTIDPADLLRAAHLEKYGAEPDAELVDALREILATETIATGA